MKLQDFQDNILQYLYQPNEKDKVKKYQYTIIALGEAIFKIEQAYVFNYTNKSVLIKEIGNALSYSIKIFKDLDFSITSKEFDLEVYKTNIHQYFTNKSATFDSVLQTIRFVFSLSQEIVKKNIESKKDLSDTDKLNLINQLIDINIKLFTICHILNFNIDVILEKELQFKKKLKNSEGDIENNEGI